ncbi:hypothetical protein DFP72DRAFT_839488 [Ephemerocybe angulata]|uniref:Integrase core domain-containing protein n=1 Tax=Ephemerocybe angulata TaxID=980116 RepID=A0A8H6MH29_9AGAR|nr:hypothetical protein DFP72DRAFT_839488 [Tulosesus angulatus]
MEKNEIERRTVEKWGLAHRAYLRGRSVHNVRIERLWRDVQRDSLEDGREEEPMAPRSDHFASLDEEVEAGIVITDDEFIAEAREAVKNMDLGKDDGSWGIDVYCEVVLRLTGLWSWR